MIGWRERVRWDAEKGCGEGMRIAQGGDRERASAFGLADSLPSNSSSSSVLSMEGG